MLVPKAQVKTAISMQGKPESLRRLDPRAITPEVLTKIVNLHLNSQLDPSLEGSLAYPFEVAGRSRGNLVVSQWLDEGSPYRAILNLVQSAPQIDQLQLSVVTSRTKLNSESWPRALNRSANGRASLEITLNGVSYWASPFETLATNRSLDRWFARWLEQRALTSEGFFKLGGQIALLELASVHHHPRRPGEGPRDLSWKAGHTCGEHSGEPGGRRHCGNCPVVHGKPG